MAELLPDEIIVGDRHRKASGDIESMVRSLVRIGLLNPIVVDVDNKLYAGFRRLKAWKKAFPGKPIPITRWETLSIEKQKEIELEENIQRKDLTWQERASAIFEYSELRIVTDEEWSTRDTASELNVSQTNAQRSIIVGRAISEDTENKFEAVESLAAAYNLIKRALNRQIDVALEIVEVDADEIIEPEEASTEEEINTDLPPKPEPPTITAPVLCENFNEWAKTYSGPKFNFIHCDFPYGIKHGQTKQSRGSHYETYTDEREDYFTLINTLIDNKERFMTEAAHIMFWFSMNNYITTKRMFEEVNFVVNPFPLIWFKNDSRAILPDPKRGPRRAYETAFLITQGDRYVVKPVTNLIAHPSGHKEHISEKPQGMLKQFFRMLVDDTTKLLDPTCGAGSALRAAHMLGAERVLGLEFDRGTAEQASRAFLQQNLDEDELELDPEDLEL